MADRTKELEAFSYSVFHDLKAPLRTVDAFSRTLSQEHADDLNPQAKRLLDLVRSNTANMGAPIDDLLAFSHLGRKEVVLSDINMEALAQEAFEELKADASGRALRFTVDALPPALGDRAMMRLVFTNLLGNAVKFTRPRKCAVVAVGGRREGAEHVYYVRDNGVGFDTKYAGKLFGVFHRLNDSKEFEGTGVGLAIVERVVKRHGGRVWGEGALDKGATFYFALPREARTSDG